jgi:hypothetical protein
MSQLDLFMKINLIIISIIIIGRWGPNHAADPIVSRWKKDEDGEPVIHPKTNKKILQFVAIERLDTNEWAIPGVSILLLLQLILIIELKKNAIKKKKKGNV